MAVPPHDALDATAWTVGITGIILAIAFLRLPYDASKDQFEETNKHRIGFAFTFAALGFFLFLYGIMIIAIWPFAAIAGGIYNVLFGGIHTLAGLLLIVLAAAIYFNTGLKPVSYFAFVVALYAINDAIGILSYRLTRTPEISAIAYLLFGITAMLSVPLTHINNKAVRYLFIIVAAIFGLLWIYLAFNFTLGHLQAPV